MLSRFPLESTAPVVAFTASTSVSDGPAATLLLFVVTTVRPNLCVTLV
jgi:hypothetical protein